MHGLKNLLPFVPNEWTPRIELSLSLSADEDGLPARQGLDFQLVFRLKTDSPELLRSLLAESGSVRTKKTNPAVRRDELWRNTCFEAFFGVAESPAYFELNLAPNGDWAFYNFDDYRTGMRSPRLTSEEEPLVVIRAVDATHFEVECFISAEIFGGNKIESLSAAAVLENGTETSYWATHHAGAEPDFHLRDSFASF